VSRQDITARAWESFAPGRLPGPGLAGKDAASARDHQGAATGIASRAIVQEVFGNVAQTRPTLSDSRDRPTHSHRAPSGALPTQIPPPAVGRRIGLPFEGLIMSEAIILFGRGMAAKATTISRCACVGTNGFGPPRPTILRQVDCCTAERSALFRPDQAIGGSDRRPRSHQRLSDLNSAGGPRGLCGLRSATKIGDSVGAGFTRFARDPSVRGKACRRASHRKRHTSRPCSARRH